MFVDMAITGGGAASDAIFVVVGVIVGASSVASGIVCGCRVVLKSVAWIGEEALLA